MLTPWKRVYVQCDYAIEPELQSALKKIIENTPVRSMGADALCAKLQTEYPFVSGLAISYRGSLTANVLVQAFTPWVSLASVAPGQKEYVVCKGGVVIEKKYFNEHVLQGLPAIVLQLSDYMHATTDPEVLQCALELRRDLFSDYTIIWKSKVEVIAQSKDKTILIIADAFTIHEKERFGFVHRIFAADKERYKNGMKADIRLRDEIICSPL